LWTHAVEMDPENIAAKATLAGLVAFPGKKPTDDGFYNLEKEADYDTIMRTILLMDQKLKRPPIICGCVCVRRPN
jgi:hypothetical protein